MILALYALVAPASAHFPHDVAHFVATGGGHVTTSVWRTEFWLAADTPDGLTFTHQYLFPGDAKVSAAAWLDGVLWLGTDDGLWKDDGTVQQVVPGLTVSDVVVRDGSLVASSDHGVYVDGLAVTSAATTDLSDDGWWALQEDGTVLSLGDLTLYGDAGVDANSIDSTPGGALVVATGSGVLVSTDGATFVATGLTDNTTLVDALTDDIWLAAGDDFLWRTEDAGATWTTVTGLEITIDGVGGPLDGQHYLETETSDDGRLFLASWEGLCVSEDLGATWTQWQSETPHTLRDVAWVSSSTGAPWLAAATYGAGIAVWRTDETEVAAWAAWNLPYQRGVALSPDFDTDQRVWAYGNSTLRASDGNAIVGTDIDEPEHFTPLPGGGLVIGGRSLRVRNTADIAWSSDGTNFTESTVDGECTATVSAMARGDDGVVWAGCQDGQVLRSDDGGVTFTQVTDVGVQLDDLAPPVGTGPVYIGTHDGLWTWDGTTAQQVALDGEYVYRVADAPLSTGTHGGYLLVSSFNSGLWEDDGAGLTALAPPTSEVLTGLALSPDFEADRGVAISSYNGLWFSMDQGRTWTQSLPWERYADADPNVRSAWTSTAQPLAVDGISLIGSDPTQPLVFTFEGRGVGIYGLRVPSGARASVQLDASPPLEVDFGGHPAKDDRVWFSGPVDDGWHTLTVTPVLGNVTLDGFQVWLQQPEATVDTGGDTDTADTDSDTDTGGEPDTDSGDSGTPHHKPPTTKDPGCGGCATAGDPPTGALLALLALAIGRRRRA